MKSLFNISAEYLMLMNEIEELEGEITPEIESALKINQEQLEEKCRAYHCVIQLKKGDIKIAEDEISRLNSHITKSNNLIERLKKSVGEALELYGEFGKSGNKKLSFPNLTIYNVYHKPLYFEDEANFNESEYCKLNLIDKLSFEQGKQVADLLGYEAKDLFANFNRIILKKEIKDALLTGTEIKGVAINKTANYIIIK
jgi:hypothetical protein